MSQKITSKNLSYSSSLPPFLAALHAQAAGGATGPDPLAASRRRSGKKRSDSQEAEDRPLVVDDQGNALDVELDRDGAVVADEDNEASAAAGDAQREDGAKPAGDEELPKTVEAKATIGARKRKVGRIVGAGDDDDHEGSPSRGDAEAKKGQKQSAAPAEKKAKKKDKKIKLSFDDEEG